MKNKGKRPVRILFVCHGNICRSPMAESVLADMIKKRSLSEKITVASAAAHTDEIGNPPHRGTREKLLKVGIPLIPHRARLLTRADADEYDLFLGMDEYNVRDMRRILGENCKDKIFMLLDFTAHPRAIADPWYTGNFDETFEDITEGCVALLKTLFPNN